jgi:predicted transposase/invertase (TIGR01784 family)
MFHQYIPLTGQKYLQLIQFNLKTYLNAKHSCLDVSARDGTGKRYNIEMQVRGGKQYIARAIYYHDRLFSDQLVEREEYHVLKKTLSISILNFVLLSDREIIKKVTGIDINDIE